MKDTGKYINILKLDFPLPTIQIGECLLPFGKLTRQPGSNWRIFFIFWEMVLNARLTVLL